MLKNKRFLLIALLACIVGSVGAQTDSPYSRYGYGVLKDQAVGPSKGMGGIGYGLRNSRSANPLNPASYSKVDSLTFLFDIGITYNSGKLSDGQNSQNKPGGGLDYITILVPLKYGLGFSFGVLPYSSVGYKFGSTENTGSLYYTKSFSGTGGFSQVYGGLGYSVPYIEGLSVGANASFLFGTIDHIRSIPGFSGTGTSTAYTSSDYSELTKKALKLDFGVQYELPMSKTDVLTLGAVFSPKMNSKADFENRHYEINSSTGVLVSGDTTLYKGVDAGLPATYGLGFTYNRDDRLIFGADVTYQKWSDVKYSSYLGDGLSDADRFNDRWKFNTGVEYMVNPFDRSFFKRMKFRGGVNYSNSYLNVENKDGVIDGYNEYGATVGLGLPFKNSYGGRTSYVNINFEYKKLKPKTSNMISEEYFAVSLNVNLSELWFFRRKVE
ncbi:MAG: OmpP1/FadL family transporter [Dysgonomonas sp.]